MSTTNYAEAKRRARKEFGANGDARRMASVVAGAVSFLPQSYQVGTFLKGKFAILGEGTSWEAAFVDAKKREILDGDFCSRCGNKITREEADRFSTCETCRPD